MTRSMDPEPKSKPVSYLAGQFNLSDAEFKLIRKLVYERFGINLTEQKRTLVVGRLQKVLRQKKIPNFKQYLDYVTGDATGNALGELVNRISTNHTYFFRESKHFDFLVNTALPYVVQNKEPGDKDLRIWCAGCSSGEEAYGIVMMMMEFFGQEYPAWDAGLLATDISAEALGAAIDGVYPDERVAAVPSVIKKKYFEPKGREAWQVKPKVKQEVTFRRFNLMNKKFPFKKPFDIIFCRNVMIYFDQPTREALVRRYYDFTMPGGFLFIGHSESLRRGACPYEYITPAVYTKRPAS